MKSDSVILIGGSGAIGSALSEAFVRRGFAVGVLSPGLTSRLEDLQKRLPMVSTCEADATKKTSLRRGLDSLISILGAPAVLIYCAGLPPDVEFPIDEYPIRQWNRTLAVYITGAFLTLREAMRVLSPGGHVVMLSSAITRFSENSLPPIYAGHYAASKAALDELCKWTRRELHGHGVLLSRLAPCAVDMEGLGQAPHRVLPPVSVTLTAVVQRVVDIVVGNEEIDEQMVGEEPPCSKSEKEKLCCG